MYIVLTNHKKESQAIWDHFEDEHPTLIPIAHASTYLSTYPLPAPELANFPFLNSMGFLISENIKGIATLKE